MLNHITIGIRSALAFVIPPIVGMVLFVVCLPLGRRRATNLGTAVVCWLGLGLAGIRLQVDGESHLLGRRPAIFVINHQSGTDPIIVASLVRRDMVAIGKHELQFHPLLGPLMRMFGTVFVKREQGLGPKVLAPVLPALAAGDAVVLAAEGRRSRDGRLQPFKSGALWLAQQSGAPLIPVVLHNSGEVLPAQGLLMKPGTVRITVLSPQPATLTTEQLRQVFVDALEA
ncbi:lysophospholipid acyltransferase family protein [Alcanivorax jadensis]|uniref:lysophospholipid acyltransferase family protein n=1 Tax=Alcanivorax jadensis TaxID=64988 RepID=UPI0035652D62